MITDTAHIGNLNPFRYRGYFYDRETGLYYLKTRYYDPQTGRFINMDNIKYADPKSINGLNLYAYCYNNPMSYVDETGTDAVLITHYTLKIGGGIPFLGHSVLLIQDGDGKWHLTEFSGSNKYDAELSIKDYDLDNLTKQNSRFENPTTFLGKAANALNLYGYDMVYLTGDYTPSYERAKNLSESNDNGYNKQYNLVMNNCLDYVQDVLKASNVGDENSLVQGYHAVSGAIAPAIFSLGTKLATAGLDILAVVEAAEKIRVPLQNIYGWIRSKW